MPKLSPLARMRLAAFRANRRAWWSLWLFMILFVVSLFAEVVANDKPVLIRYDGGWYAPILFTYSERDFGGDFETEAVYRDPYLKSMIEEKGWMVWPPIPYHYQTINYDLASPAPSPPNRVNWLGTDDQGRDVLARLIYGLRISILFGLGLTITSTVIGLMLGAVQGYFGGKTDLLLQRFTEIWGGLPILYLIIILASIIQPGVLWLLLLLMFFSWMGIAEVVRAEFLRVRNFDYVRAARAMGVKERTILTRHVLPNAVVATITLVPFLLNGSITTLTSLDFLGFGLPPGSASLGELLAQGKNNPHAPWLGLTGFAIISITLSLLIFLGEGVRDALDPRKTFREGA